MKHYELTTTPILHPPAPLGEGGKKVEELGRKLSLRGREGWEKVFLVLVLFLTIPLCYKSLAIN